MKNETKAKTIKLGAKIILNLSGVGLLGDAGSFVYEMGKDYLPEATTKLIDSTIDSTVDFFADEAGDFAKGYLTNREKYVNFHLARGICKVWEDSLTESLPKNRAANFKYFLLPQDSLQDFSEQIEFFIEKFKEAQEVGKENLLIELFYDKDKSEQGFYETFFAGVQNEISAEDAYWATLEKTLIRWSIIVGKFRYEWKNGFPEDFQYELKKFFFGNLRIGLKEIFDKNEEFRNAFEYSAHLLTIKYLQNLPEEIKEQIENAQTENRFNFSQLQLRLDDVFIAIRERFEYALNPETVKRIDETTQETKELVRQMLTFLPQIIEFLKNQPKQSKPEFKGFHKSFPFPPKYFTGRDGVLEQLEKTLETENQASFYGTHGLGKTRTAIEFALRHQKEFDFVLFISATKGNFVNNAAVVGGEISKDIEAAMTLEAKFGLFLEYLQNRANWLIIVDNVEDILEVKGIIPKHFHGKVIYTSNLPDIYNVATSIPIEAMTQTEAELTLFRRKYEYKKLELSETSIEEQRAITAIVEKIGTLPIGLNLAGAFVHKYQRTFQEYLIDYEAFEDATFQHFDIGDYYEAEYLKGLTDKEKDEYKGIAGVFLLTYQRIITPKDDSEQEKLITETIKAIMNLSVFLAPERVPEEIWKEGLKLIDETLAEASENAMCWIEVGKRLTQSAFFVRNDVEKTSTTHRLILTILQKQLKDEEKRKFAEIAVDIINGLYPQPDYENWKVCNRFLRHAETTLNYAENLKIETNNVARLCNQIAYYVDVLADYEKAIIYYQKALFTYDKTVGKEHSYYATCLNNLANVYQSQGRYDDAIEKYEEALRIDEKTIGKEHPDYATRLSNSANVYRLQGKYDDATKFYNQVLLIYEKTIGKECLNYAIGLSSLALVYDSQGKYDEAIEKYEEALRIDEKTIGKEHPDYAIHLNNLAMVYHSQGRNDEAIEKYEEALRIDVKTIGKEHPEYARHLNNLASVYLSQDKFEVVEKLYEQAKQIREKTLGKEHPDTAITYWWFAELHIKQSKFDEALPFYQDALLIFEKTLPENHPHIQLVRKSLENCRKATEKEREK